MKRVFLLIIFLSAAVPSFATIRYTDDNGAVSSASTCTARTVGSGACTATFAMSLMVAGDTLIFLDGTYNVRFGVGGSNNVPNCNSGSPCVIKAENRRQAILLPSGGVNDGWAVFNLLGQDYVRVEGFVIDCTNLDGNGGFYIQGAADHVTIYDNEIKNANKQAADCLAMGSGILSRDNPTNVYPSNTWVAFNNIHDNGLRLCLGANGNQPAGGGMYLNGTNDIIEDNDVHDNGHFGMQANAGSGTTGVTIRRNRIHGNAEGMFLNWATVKVYNNLIYDNAGPGIWQYNGCGTLCEAYFNVLYRNASSGYVVESGGVNTARNNIFLANTNGAFNIVNGTNTCSNNLNVTGNTCGSAQGTVNPFVNASGGDFHLTGDDGNGTDLTSLGITTDFENVARGNPPDRGAYEFGTAMVVVRYTDDTGTDNTHATCTAVQTGSSACTFTHALALMASGDVLQLADGTYPNFCNACLPNGTPARPTTMRAANARQAILQPTSEPPGQGVFLFNNSSAWIIDGIVADCGLVTTACAPYESFPGPATNIIIKNGEAKNGKGIYGTGIDGYFITSTIQNMLVHDNGQCPSGETLSHGIYIGNSSHDTIVDGNDVYNNNCAFGITVYNGSADVPSNIIRNNKIHNNLFGLDLGAYGAETANVAYNNLIYSNNRGIEIGGVNSAAYFNTIYSNAGYCIAVNPSGQFVTLKNNICLSNGNGAILDQGTGSTCTNNLNVTGCQVTQGSANPFVNAGTDFHLTSEDNGGVAISGITSDLDNFARGNPPDRGAYDFRGTGVTAGPAIFAGRLIR